MLDITKPESTLKCKKNWCGSYWGSRVCLFSHNTYFFGGHVHLYKRYFACGSDPGILYVTS